MPPLMQSQLAAIEGKIEVEGEEGGESGWRRSEEGFHASTPPCLPSFGCVLAAARLEESNQSPICHLPFPLLPSSPVTTTDSHLLDGRGEEPTMERESPTQGSILGLQCVAKQDSMLASRLYSPEMSLDPHMDLCLTLSDQLNLNINYIMDKSFQHTCIICLTK